MAAGPLDADYRIELRDRWTGQPHSRCLLIEGEITGLWTRTPDAVSNAYVTVGVPDENSGCADCVPRPWEDLLCFYRGVNPEPVWRGPVVSWSASRNALTINAIDGMGEIGDRRATADHPALTHGTTPTVHPLDLLAWVIEQANAVTPLPIVPMTPVWPLNVPLVTAEIKAGDLLSGVLDDLSRDWIDWTAAGNRLWYGAPTILLPELPPLDTDTSWQNEPPEIITDGIAQATDVEVVGAVGIVGRYPQRLDRSTFHRPLRLVRENLTSQQQADELARDVWADSQAPQVLISTTGSLSPDCPVAPEDMIPGRTVNVTHRRAGTTRGYQQRIAGVSVSIGSIGAGSGWALAELSVQIDLQPAKLRVTGD
jgi:hypothetical protein